ncbi:MAG: methionine--tRNA ligase subunit beta, partial [Firmicutes bacterium]|nr:methionine--tRNA ligase subunit beta [Bacillota bacterium]
ISRANQTWGVPVPWDESQVVYVWFDALITYLSGAGFGWDEARFRRYWPARLHLIGKDITRFHCVIWPAMLLAAGLPLPEKVYAHGFWYCNGQRFSKSLGNVIDPRDLVQRYGLDAARYYYVAETPFGLDGNYTDESILKRTNSDLANDLGNLLSRTTAMIERYSGGRVPEEEPGVSAELRTLAEEVVREYAAAMDELRLHDAVAHVLRLVRRANKFTDERAPWELARDAARRRELEGTLYALAETLRLAGLLLSPVLVEAAPELFRQLGLPEGALEAATWEEAAWGRLPAGTQVRRGAPLFPRLDPEKVPPLVPVRPDAGAEVQAAAGRGVAEGADAEMIDYDTFARLDLRVATIVAAERVEGTRKLLKLTVSLDGETRQIVSGIAEHYAPEELAGRQVVLVANLKPAVIRGVRSEGMLLAASAGGRLALVVPETAMPDGARVT